MDFIFDNITKEWIIFQAILMNFIVIPCLVQIHVNIKSHSITFPKLRISKGVIICLITIFCLFASYDGDYFSYLRNFRELTKGQNPSTSLEDIYKYIIEFRLIDTYLYFRLIVWGGGLMIYWLSFDRVGINDYLIWVIFTSTTLLSIAYIRVFLGMACAFYGYTYLIKPSGHKILSYTFGLIMISLSLFLHKSMFIIIGCTLLSVFINKNWAIILSIISFPIVCNALTLIVIAILGTDQEGLNYLESEATTQGSGIKLYLYMRFTFVIGCLIYLLLQAFKNSLPKDIRKCLFFAYYILYIYLLFEVVFIKNGMGGAYLSDRIFVMIFTVLPILYYYGIKYSKKPVWFLLGLWLATLAFNYRLFYSYYLQSLNTGMNMY